MIPNRLVRAVTCGAIGVVLLLSGGCGDDDGVSAESKVQGAANVGATSSDAPTLLLAKGPAGGPSRGAKVAGTLGVNSAGCFTLDDYVLIAPAGSGSSSDGQSVELAGVGRFQLGDKVSAGGGYIDDPGIPVPEEWKECIAEGSPAQFVSVDSGRG